MDKPTMFEPYKAAADIDVVPSYFPIPGLGIIPVNAFVLKAAQPVLVDTGLVPLSDEFMEKLSSVIDAGDLRWLWLTHTDQDHIGSLWRVLEAAPKLRIITTYLGVGKMSLFAPLPMDRIYLLNPGQSISVGDRILTAIKPPSYDAPETTGFYDPKAARLWSSGQRWMRHGFTTWTEICSLSTSTASVSYHQSSFSALICPWPRI